MPRPTLFLLHALGLSARSWDGVIAALGPDVRCVALDLPGFGSHADSTASTVQETATWVAHRIAATECESWVVAGHSMGGKIATIVAAWAEAGEHGLTPAAGVVLVDASTPSPEPMEEDRRLRMADWWASGAISAEDAAAFVDANLAGPIPPSVRGVAVEDVQRTNRAAWLEWLNRGSLEHWAAAVGVLRTPAVIVVGATDGDLGAANQERLNRPHYPNAAVHEIDDAAHYVVLEQPAAVAQRIAAFVADVADRPALPAAFARLIASDRVSARTRAVMLGRIAEPGGGPRTLSGPQRALLTALLARVVPQRGTDLDLAGRIDAQLASGAGDGWRFAELPPDAEAWRLGLDTVAAMAPDFAALPPGRQDAVLDRIEAGDADDGPLTPAQLVLWFQDVRAEAVRTWLSHPSAQAWLRYDGFADGGDGQRKQGFITTHAGEWESWQRDWRTGTELDA